MEKQKSSTTKIIIATTFAASALTLSLPSAIDNQIRSNPIEIRRIIDHPNNKIRSIFEMVRGKIFDEAEASFKNGKWDFTKLQELQKEYKKVRFDFGKYGIFSSNAPEDVIAIMPEIRKASERYNVNPYLVAGIVATESYGYPFAIHLKYNKWRSDNELSTGFMQVNLLAHPPKTAEEYKNIFKVETNLDKGVGILRECIDNTNNMEMAVRAYNGGVPSNSVRAKRRWMAKTSNYIQKVRMYTELIRRTGI